MRILLQLLITSVLTCCISPAIWIGIASAEEEPAKPVYPAGVKSTEIENLYRLSKRIYCGAQPEGSKAFVALKRLGVKTIVSVDGATPDVETAKQSGIRYVHLPIAYDGVETLQSLRIVRAVDALPGPVFIHCHHGKHRGPAAAALCGIALEGWNQKQAALWLKQAGTSPKYKGLYRSVENFQPPPAVQLEKITLDFPARATVPKIVDSMVRIDRNWEHLRAIRAAKFQTPRDHPDLDPSHEALQMAEHFRELLRQKKIQKRDKTFLTLLGKSERDAFQLHQALEQLKANRKADLLEGAAELFQRNANNCQACHVKYRNTH